ncbi:MAG TPA: methyl-accepting chemotaxis protein [Spirochaetota bacterium]|nr:methyl-accepting chemotaxis protein [Spirochaetota bacterium]
MNIPFRVSIRHKILIGSIGIATIACLSIAMLSYIKAGSIIDNAAEQGLTGVTNHLLNLCRTNYELSQKTVNYNLNVADFFVKGKTELRYNRPIRYDAEDQITHAKTPVTIPTMAVEGTFVSNSFGLVDRVTDMIGGTVTIFQRMTRPNGLLRISTSVKRKDGSRAVGTYIPESSPVYKTIMRRETFRGNAFVVNDWYITAYKPIIGAGNEIIGTIYVGIKQSEMDVLRNKILSVKHGASGSTYVIDDHENSRGTLVIHSSMEGTNILDRKDADGVAYVREICSRKNGSGVYSIPDPVSGDVRTKMLQYRHLPEMGWIIVAEGDYDEINSPLFSLRNTMIVVGILCVIFIVVLGTYFSNSVSSVVRNIVNRIKLLKEGDFSKDIPDEDMARNDEFGVMAHHFSQLIQNTRELLGKVRQTTEVLTESIQDLTISSKEISSTSNQQAAAVKEIVSTMEDSDSLSKKVASRIDEVARIANQTKEFVEKGFSLIKETLEKMDDIQNTNAENISGVRSLGTQIESIWEVVNIINGIADQTKIIAFNAELEASAAGDAGKNFQIVASEVRRLADSTVSSTNEIRQKIDEIQRSSDNLVLSTERGTERIREGWERSTKLREVFDEILNSAEVSAASSEQIVASVNQQVSAFEQILLTLRQISQGIDDFVVSTRATTSASESLKETSEDLKASLAKYILS